MSVQSIASSKAGRNMRIMPFLENSRLILIDDLLLGAINLAPAMGAINLAPAMGAINRNPYDGRDNAH